MKTKKYIFLLPLLLTGCLSSGSGSSSPGIHSPRDPNNGDNSSNKPSTSGSTLSTFIDTEKFKNDVIASNNSNIKKAFETANVATNETNINIATEALKANLAETNYISSRVSKLTNVIDNYESNYKSKLETVNKSEQSYLPLYYDGKYTPKQDGESNESFAPKLYLILQNRYANYEAETAETYISKTLNSWALDINKVLGSDVSFDGPIENVFSTLYTQLKDSIDKVNNDLNTAKTELLTKIKEVDSSITDFPLSLEALMNYYKLEQSILKAIGSVEYINPPNATTNEYTAHSIYDTSGKQSVKFEYNEDTKDYSLVLTDIGTGTNHKQNRTVRFQPSDFVSNSGYYKAEKTITDGKSTVSYTYLPDLKNYITAGGTLDIFARKNNATNIIKKVLYNSAPTQTDINDFNKWFGTTLATDSVLTEDIKSSAQLVIKMLEKADTNFDITQTNTITDIVKLGGKSLNLSYSDFGLWTVKGATQYSGDNDLINAKKDTEAKSSYYYIDNPFYSGLDEFKVGFTKQSDAGINSLTKFSGTAIASASKDNVRKDLTGTALLNINNQTAKGDINLSFDSWYGFAFNNIDFSSNNGFSLNNTDVAISGDFSASDIKITSTAKGNISGALYGPNSTTPVEGVGNYNITTGDNVKIDGAFGVKK